MIQIRACGERCEEGFVAWSGVSVPEGFKVCSVLPPTQNGSEHVGGLLLSDAAMESIADQILRKREILIAQVHSHPGEAFHSHIDDNYPLIHRTGFLSIVIPYFGRYGFDEFHRFRTFQYVKDGRWIELSTKAQEKRIRLEGESRWKRIRSRMSFIRGRDN
jgi:hypothetical protein